MPTPPRHRPAPAIPFWQRLPEIATYPLRGAAFASLAVLSLGTLLGYVPTLGLLFELIVWASAYKYGFEILRATADGRMAAPETTMKIGNYLVWRFIGLQILFAIVIGLATWLGGFGIGVLTLAVVALMQPGSTISLAIDGSLLRALDPSTSIDLLRRIGLPYLAACGLLFALQAIAIVGGEALAIVMPAVLGDLLLAVVVMWGLFAAFHLMGYLVYQYHEVLGYEPETHRDALPQRADRDREIQEQAEALVRDGDPATARALLRDDIRTRTVSLATHEMYRRLLASSGDAAALDEHARLHLNVLMLETQDRRALGVLRESLDANPDFVPLQIEHAETLITRARGAGQMQLALDLWQALIRRHPREPAATRWALDAAHVLSDRFDRSEAAYALLRDVRARCSDASQIAALDAALAALPPR